MSVVLENEEYDIMFAYGLVGLAIDRIQTIESFLSFCMCAVFKDKDGKTLEDLTNTRTRKKTLGQFLTRLRTKTEIDPNLDKIFEQFLEHRNTLIHNIKKDPLCDFHTPEGRKHVCNFLYVMDGLSDTVTTALLGIIMYWVEPEKYDNVSEYRVRFAKGTILGDAEQIFAPHINKLIRVKS